MKVAAYARYSSDAQREASLEDQLRNCRQYAARMGWPEPVVYTDAAVSGAPTLRGPRGPTNFRTGVRTTREATANCGLSD